MSKQRALRLKAWLLTLCMVITLIPTTAFAAGNNTKTYVSLGDSMSNGYGLDGYDEKTSGYNGYDAAAYPNVFHAWLEEQDGYENAVHKQMAMSAMRAEDLHFLLEASATQANLAEEGPYDKSEWSSFPAGDKYTYDTMVNYRIKDLIDADSTDSLNTLADVVAAYQSAVIEADLISLNIGSADFGMFMMQNIAGAFDGLGELIDAEPIDSDWKDMLSDNDSVMGDKMLTMVDKLDSMLTAQLSSLGEAADPVVDAVLYTTVSYLMNYEGVLDRIMALNSDAEVILVGLTDATAGMDLSFEVKGETIPLNVLMELMVESINTYIASLPAVQQSKKGSPYEDATFYYVDTLAIETPLQYLADTFEVGMFDDGENELIRKRFVEEIVGGFIWDMAGDMLSEYGSLISVDIEEDVKVYEAALAEAKTGDISDLKSKFIDPILNPVVDEDTIEVEGPFANEDDKEAAKQAAIEEAKKEVSENATNRLLSVAFYLSIETAVLESSGDNKIDINGLMELIKGDIMDAFASIEDVVTNPNEDIIDNNDAMIKDIIVAVVNSLSIGGVEFEGVDVLLTPSLEVGDIEDLIAGTAEDADDAAKADAEAVYIKLIAQGINKRFAAISEEDAITAVKDILDNKFTGDEVAKLAAEWMKGKPYEVLFDGDEYKVTPNLEWNEIQMLIIDNDNEPTKAVYRKLLAKTVDAKFFGNAAGKIIDPETGNEVTEIVTATDIKNFLKGDFSSDAAYKVAAEWMKGKNFDVDFDKNENGKIDPGETYNVGPFDWDWKDVEGLAKKTAADEVYYDLIAQVINAAYGIADGRKATAESVAGVASGNTDYDFVYDLAADKLAKRTFNNPLKAGKAFSPDLNGDEVEAIIKASDPLFFAAAQNAYYELIAQAINAAYDLKDQNPEDTADNPLDFEDITKIYNGNLNDYPVVYKLAEDTVNGQERSIDYRGGSVTVVIRDLLSEDIQKIANGGNANDLFYYDLVAQAINGTFGTGLDKYDVEDVLDTDTTNDGALCEIIAEVIGSPTGNITYEGYTYTLESGDIEDIVAGTADEVYYRWAAGRIADTYGVTVFPVDIANIYAGNIAGKTALYRIVAEKLSNDLGFDVEPEQVKNAAGPGEEYESDVKDIETSILDAVEKAREAAAAEIAARKQEIAETVDDAKEAVASNLNVGVEVKGRLDEAVVDIKAEIANQDVDGELDGVADLINDQLGDIKSSVADEIDKKLSYPEGALEKEKEGTAQYTVESAFEQAKDTVPGIINDKLTYEEGDEESAKKATAKWQMENALKIAESKVAENNLNQRYQDIRKLFAMDELVVDAMTPELKDLLYIFGRTLIGNGVGSHLSANGHATLAAAVQKAYEEKHTVQEELNQDVGLLLVGMAGLMAKFGAEILDIALDSDTIKQYIQDRNISGAVNALISALDAKFGNYAATEETLTNAITTLENKLKALTNLLNDLSEKLEEKEGELAAELSFAFEKASDVNAAVAETAVDKLSGAVIELAELIDKTRNAIVATEQALSDAKMKLAALRSSVQGLKDAAETLQDGVSDMEELITELNKPAAFVDQILDISENVRDSIDDVKEAYHTAESALSSAKVWMTTAANNTVKVYDEIYDGLLEVYKMIPADLVPILFGAAGVGGYVALTLAQVKLVPWAEALPAKLDQKVADKEADLAALLEKADNFAGTVEEKLELEKEIAEMNEELTKLRTSVDNKKAELVKGLKEANEGNLAQLEVSYRNLLDSIVSFSRSDIENALRELRSSGVKTTRDAIKSTFDGIKDALTFVKTEVKKIEQESVNAYRDATKASLIIKDADPDIYVALGDSTISSNDSYAERLTAQINDEFGSEITLKKFIGSSIDDAFTALSTNSGDFKNAKLVTVGYGNNAFGKLAVDRANAVLNGDSIQPLDWAGCVGAKGASYINDLVDGIENSLYHSGINELIGDGDKYHMAIAYAVEAYAYATVQYLVELPSLVTAIRNAAPDAAIAIVGMYNPLGDLGLTYEEKALDMGAYMNDLVAAIDVYGTAYAMLATKTSDAIFVNLPGVESEFVDLYRTGAENSLEVNMKMDTFMLKIKSNGIDVAPTSDGQSTIQSKVRAALDISDERTPITGVVTIDSDSADGVVYGANLTAFYSKLDTENVMYQWFLNDGNGYVAATEATPDPDYTVPLNAKYKSVKVVVTGTGEYNGEKSAVAEIELATPEYTEPDNLVGLLGEELESVEFNGPDKDHWSWKNGGSTYLDERTTYTAIFTPDKDYKDVYRSVEAQLLVAVRLHNGVLETKPVAVGGLTCDNVGEKLIEEGTFTEKYEDYGFAVQYIVVKGSNAEPDANAEGWNTAVPTVGDDTEAGTYYVWYRVTGSPFDTSEPYCIEVTVGEAVTGATVSGTVTSWNDTNDAVIRLYPAATTDAQIRADLAKATSEIAGTLTASAGTISANTANGMNRYDQSYSFDGVADGDYKLALWKPRGTADKPYVPKILPVTVSGADYNVNTEVYAGEECKLWLYGDVTYDGKVNGTDAVQIQLYYAGNKQTQFTVGNSFDIADRLLAANVTFNKRGDAAINGTDAVQIQLFFAGSNSVPCVFKEMS